MIEENKEIIAYKGFNQDWTCCGYQYEMGKTYEHKGDVKACESGFHACEYPLDAFGYYAPCESKFAVVKASGKISKDGDDSKIASAKITVEAEINIPEMVKKAVDWIKDKIDWDNAKETNTGDYSAATNTGDYSAATNTGDYSAATNTGDYSAATNTGNRSAATNTGFQSAATNTGFQSAATNTGNYSAATNTGNYSAATNTGFQSAAEVSGRHSVAIALGRNAKSKAGADGAIVCVYRNDNGDLIHIKASKVGENNIKADTWYMLDSGGEFVETDND